MKKHTFFYISYIGIIVGILLSYPISSYANEETQELIDTVKYFNNIVLKLENDTSKLRSTIRKKNNEILKLNEQVSVYQNIKKEKNSILELGKTIWSFTSFILIIILVLIFYFYKKKRSDEFFELSNTNRDLKSNYEAIRGEKKRLEKEKKEGPIRMASDNSREEEIRQLHLIIQELKDQLSKIQPLQGTNNIQKEKAPEVEWDIPKNPIIIKKYATYPDDPDGFSVNTIKDTQDNRTIYVLTMQGENLATLKISDNPASQKYALNNSTHLLGRACEYRNSPNEGNKIVTLKEGKLVKSENVWRITELVQIQFQ